MIQYKPKTVLNNYLRRIDGSSMPIDILGSSSKGNSVFLEPFNTLIDIGMPFSHYPTDILFNLDNILLTHIHSDHINIQTLTHILNAFPNINVYYPQTMTVKLKSVIAIKAAQMHCFNIQQSFVIKNRHNLPIDIQTLKLRHGLIMNTGYVLKYKSTNILYASDLNHITDLPSTNIDTFSLIMLESNYDEEMLIGQDESQIHLGNYNHLSEQKAFQYAQLHLTQNGLFIPLHASPHYKAYSQ